MGRSTSISRCRFLGVSYATVPPLTHFITNSTYFLWDVLTTAYIGKPDLVQYKSLNVDVKFKGPSQGRTFIKESGRPIKVVTDVKHDDFFNYITNLAKSRFSFLNVNFLFYKVYISGIIILVEGGYNMNTRNLVYTALMTAIICVLGLVPGIPLPIMPVPIVLQNIGIF